MAKIIITRTSEWNNRLRSVGIYVDDQKIGTIANGETKTFDIADGQHNIRAKVDWCGSRTVDFSISGEEKKYFRLSGYRYSRYMGLVVASIIILNFILKRTIGLNYVLWLIIPLFVYLLYYITFGRNDYLRLREEDKWNP